MKSLVTMMFGLILAPQLFAGTRSLDQRYDDALNTCMRPKQSQLRVDYGPSPADMVEHYRPSYSQRMSFNLYRGIFDEFGGVVQGMISGGDEAYVKPYLRILGRELRAKTIRESLSKPQSICVASCIINQLMESDESVFPTTSMELAVARGAGFCRHYLLAMDAVLKAAGISSQYGYSWDHIFFYFNVDGQKRIFDPGVSDGVYSCEFFNYVPR